MRDNNKKYKPEFIKTTKFKYATIVFADSVGKHFTTMSNTLVNLEREVFDEVRKEIRHGILVLYHNSKDIGKEDVYLEADEFNFIPLPKQGFMPTWIYNESTKVYELSGDVMLVSTILPLEMSVEAKSNRAANLAGDILRASKYK